MCVAFAEPEVRNRLGTAVITELAPRADEDSSVAVELYVTDSLYAKLADKSTYKLELRFKGRAGLRLLDGPRLDRARVRDLSLRFTGSTWQLDLGRLAPEGGQFRLVDGAQGLFEVAPNLRVGAWLGLAPDPYTTAPAARFAGGPILSWQHPKGEITLLGEASGTVDGLDRLSAVLRARGEVGKLLEVGGLADVQSRGGQASLADATVFARFDPRQDLRVDLVYDAWSSLSFLTTEQRDPALTRFAARSAALQDDVFIPQDAMDPTTYHLVSLQGRYRPDIGAYGLDVRLGGRYRYHPTLQGRFMRGDVHADLRGLLAGRLDLGLSQAVFHWGGKLGTETGIRGWVQLDNPGRLSLDVSGELVMSPLEGASYWAPTYYADAFVDWVAPRGLVLGLGYAFSNSEDLDRWDPYHAFFARLSWSFDSRRRNK